MKPRANIVSAGYTGVLKEGARTVWHCGHQHTEPIHARICAQQELERRNNEGKENDNEQG